jgi:hypothetical protein
MDIVLERFAYTPMGTFGRLQFAEFGCYTLEDPWNDNRTGMSCIPVGYYSVTPTRYNAGGYDTFEVENVQGRSQIKIHKGNTHEDVEGCIVLGLELGYIEGNWAVTSSGNAFNRFFLMIRRPPRSTRINVRNYTGGVL